MPFVAPTPTRKHDSASVYAVWLATGACLLAYTVALAWLSRRATSPAADSDTAAKMLVAFSVSAGLAYLIGLRTITRQPPVNRALRTIILVGLVMRAVLMISPPSLENDYYRYLWDGAVGAHGLDPYRYSPTHIVCASVGAESVPQEYQQLAQEAGPVFKRINHPHLTTIYPPIAQLAFTTAHWIAPWSTNSWRALLLLADAVTLVILVLLLRLLGISAGSVAWYWWNPILLRETYGGAHLDVLVLPFVMGAVLPAHRQRFAWAMLLLATATGVKLWPVILAPILLRPLLNKPRPMAAALGVFLAATAVIWFPTIPNALGPNSGFVTYATDWQNNAGAFAMLERFCRHVLTVIGDHHFHWAQPVSRGLVAVTLLAWIGWQIRKPVVGHFDLPRRCFMVTAALFLLSPTQFPWYYLWIVPFLAVFPNLPLLPYCALLPLYYVHQRHPGVVWLEHGLVWLLLASGFVVHLVSGRRLHSVPSQLHPEVSHERV